jgi:hypothetical protein
MVLLCLVGAGDVLAAAGCGIGSAGGSLLGRHIGHDRGTMDDASLVGGSLATLHAVIGPCRGR